MIVLPLNRCHDSSQYSPSSSLSASCNDSVGIFKRLADTAFSFFSRFFQPHFLIINIPAFVARAEFFGPHRAKFFCTLTLCRFCFVLFCFVFFFVFLVEANRQDLFFFISCFLHNRPFDNAGIGAQLISCQNITVLLCHYDIFGVVDRWLSTRN